ncbi:Microfibrillar-associated protein 1 [Strongyloides ratti]|uniref:Microfibrillar-associated protein 1 n=1 Tax=Strongyloides ratti TaxID=34506 RepID=A0A090LEY5_STRRB|nr:Microfibrillar-associated protein 1 [Strongyloides ratti]CEF68322.1 Microfibrillar-associated protein 1 [Strongyloides ratti]
MNSLNKTVASRISKITTNVAAVPYKNEKGQVVMKKVKVQRYVAGKAPACSDSESDDSIEIINKDDFDKIVNKNSKNANKMETTAKRDSKVHDQSESESSEDEEEIERRRMRIKSKHQKDETDELESINCKDELELDDDEDNVIRRRTLLKSQKLKDDNDEINNDNESEDESVEEESSEEESEEEEDDLPRLKPVFVPRKDRVTLLEIQKEKEAEMEAEMEEEKRKEARKQQSVSLLEMTLKAEKEAEEVKKLADALDLTEIVTDDDDDEIAYELWKIREINRLKRDREEREMYAREQEEIEKLRNMTEEERDKYFEMNPKIITNKQAKGKLKFLQKYFHRGAFFLDKNDEILSRDFTETTLDDNFDKTVLPKVMQVKNFGKSSRTKWTHLTAEDTTDHQGAWAAKTNFNQKFTEKHAAGMKNIFVKPTSLKRKHE